MLIRGCQQVNRMSDHYHAFNNLEVNTVNQATGFLRSRDRLKLCGLLEESIGFQHGLLRNTQSVKDDHGYDNMAMCHNRCIFNMDHLYHAYWILKSDGLPTFFTVIRTVFESFPKLFYCMRHAEDAKHIFRCEMFLWWKRRQDADELKELDDGEIARRFYESDDVARSFYESVKKPINRKECRDFERPRWFREKVYTEDRVKEICKTYNEYSQNTHPTFEPLYTRTREELEHGWNVGIHRLTGLSLMNAFVMVNATERGLKARGKYESSKSFVEYAMRNAGGDVRHGMARLYPDKDEYTKTLPFPLPRVGSD